MGFYIGFILSGSLILHVCLFEFVKNQTKINSTSQRVCAIRLVRSRRRCLSGRSSILHWWREFRSDRRTVECVAEQCGISVSDQWIHLFLHFHVRLVWISGWLLSAIHWKLIKNGLWKGWQSIVAIPLFTENRSKTDSGRADNQLSPLHYWLKIDQKWTLERADNQLSPLHYSLEIDQKWTLGGLKINCFSPPRVHFCSIFNK